MRVLFANFFAVLLVTSASMAVADDTQDRLNRLLSEDFARASQTALETGDRASAIIAALRGLPAEPSDDDMAKFSAAADMLFRAVGSRAMRIDRSGYQSFSVNSQGDRAVIGPAAGSGMNSPDTPLDPYLLVDPRTGVVLAELLPGRETHQNAATIAAPIPFAPDGSSLAIQSFRTGDVHLFDGRTGTALGTLSGLGMT